MAARHASELELMRFDDEFEGTIRLDEPMARHTTYRIGGFEGVRQRATSLVCGR